MTEIYNVDVKGTPAVEYAVVQIRPTLAKVSAPTKTAATATEGAKTTWTVAGLTLVDYTSVVNAVNDVDNFNSDVALVKDAYVLVYGNADAGYTVAPATLVEGKVTGYASKTNAWTIGDASYPVSLAAVYASAATAISGTTTVPATYAVDTYGNVIGSVSVTIPDNFIYVVGAQEVSVLDPETNIVTSGIVKAKVITTEGKLETVTVAKYNGAAAAATDLRAGGIYTYTLDLKGNYLVESGATSKGAFEVTQIVKNNAQVGTAKYANNNTAYYIAQTTKVDGVDVITSVAPYTGYTNVPSLTSVSARGLDVNADGIAEVIFVMPATEAISAVSYVYLTGSYNIVGTDCVYDAIIKGETTTIKLPAGKSAGLYSIATDGTITAEAGSAMYLTYNAGVLLNGTSAADTAPVYYSTVGADVPVYTIDKGVCTASTAADLAATGSAAVTVATETVGAVTSIVAIYIVK